MFTMPKDSALQRVPRPFGKVLRGEKPGEALHMDYFSLKDAIDDEKGLLVCKDGVSGHLLLVEAKKFDSATAEAAAVHWASLFGVPRFLTTDEHTL